MVNVFQHSFLFEFKIMCWKEFIQKNCFKISSKKVSKKFLLPSINPHVLSISQFSDCESILSSKRTGGSNNSAMFDPPLGQTRLAILTFSPLCLHVRVYSLATTFQTRCISITFVNKLEPFNTWRTQLCWEIGRAPFLISTRTSSSYFSSPLHGNRGEHSGR